MQRWIQSSTVNTSSRQLSRRRRPVPVLLPIRSSHNPASWAPKNVLVTTQCEFSSRQQLPSLALFGMRRRYNHASSSIRYFTTTSSEDTATGSTTYHEATISEVQTMVAALLDTEHLSDDYDYDDDDYDDDDYNHDHEFIDDFGEEQHEMEEEGPFLESTAGKPTNFACRGQLNNWYQANFGVNLKDAFVATKSRKNRWKSTFVCPITQHQIQGVYVPGLQPDNASGKKLANQAAAWAAMLFFQPLEGNPAQDPDSTLARKRLQCQYMKKYKIVLPTNAVTCQMMQRSGKKMGGTWWTGSFRCPVTEDVFPSLVLARYESCVLEDNRVYYRRKGDAIQAAFEKALLAMQTSTVGSVKEEHEVPFDVPALEPDPSEDEHDDHEPACSKDKHDLYINVDSYVPLQVWYKKNHNLVLTNDNFVVTMESWKGSGGNRWTASFICPATGNRYDSGELLRLPPHLDSKKGGIQWYQKKIDAITAAGLRAYDELVFQESGKTNPRFCREDPSRNDYPAVVGREDTVAMVKEVKERLVNQVDQELSALQIDDVNEMMLVDQVDEDLNALQIDDIDELMLVDQVDEDLSALQITEVHEKKLVDQVDQELSALQTNNTYITYSTAENESLEDDDVDDDEDDHDDYIVEYVPQRIGRSNEGTTAPSTLDLVVETLIHTSQLGNTIPSTVPTHSAWTSSALKKMRGEAVQRARAWVSQQQADALNRDGGRIRFDKVGIPTTPTIAKVLLQNLAHANRASSDENKLSVIEEAAKSIIDILFSSPGTLPDADCFALYIQCLEGGPRSVCKKAEHIFNVMATGGQLHGHVMPPPNTLVLNSLLQRKAEAGILPDLSELEGVEVDKLTLLSCLSAVSHATGKGGYGFDTQYALDCIQEMKVREEAKGRSWEPGIDVYNAPMRWNANVGEALTSRPYTRPIAWNGLDILFKPKEDIQKAFTDQDPAVREAQAIEDWFRSIDAQAFGSGVRPNIETYESAIQAWIRTRTSEGLDHAEEILDLLYSKQNEELKIRPQTMHPFLAASAHAGDFARVDKWIHKLRDQEGHTFFDSRLRAAPILARVSAKEGNDSMRKECLLLLQQAVEEAKKDSSATVEAKAFVMVIEAFNQKGIDDRNAGNISFDNFSGIQQTLELFDEFMASLLGSSDGDRLLQLHHLMYYAPMVYSSTFSALRHMQTDGGATLLGHLEWQEKLLRRSGEHLVLSEKLQERLPDIGLENGRMKDEDGFSYNFDRVLESKDQISWRDYHESVIYGLTEIYPLQEGRSNEFELLRLMFLVSKLHGTGNGIQGKAANISNILHQPHLEQTNPIFEQIRREFVQRFSYQFAADGHKEKFSPQSGLTETVLLEHQNRRRKRTEKHTKRPTHHPRKAEKRRAFQST